MSNKLFYFSDLANKQSLNLTSSRENWTNFLETSSRLYKYTFNEQLLIHAQRPDAKACAPLGFWNKPMNRYVKRGSKGIAIIDDSGSRPRLKYVFDYSDTEAGVKNPRRPFLWELKMEYKEDVINTLAESYGGLDGDLEILFLALLIIFRCATIMTTHKILSIP